MMPWLPQKVGVSFHALPQFDQHAVGAIHANQSEPRVFNVQDDIHVNGHDGREADDVDPTARAAIALFYSFYF